MGRPVLNLRTLLSAIIAILVSVCLFFGMVYQQGYAARQYERLAEADLMAIAEISKQRVLAELDRIRDNSLLIASRTQMRISLKEWNRTGAQAHKEKIVRILNDAARSLDELDSIDVFDPEGKLVASTASVSSPDLPVATTREIGNVSLLRRGDELLVIFRTDLVLYGERVGSMKVAYQATFVTQMIRQRIGLGETGEWLFAARDENGDAMFVVPLRYDHDAAFKRRVAKSRLDVPITQALLGNVMILRHAPDYLEVPVMAATQYMPAYDWGLVAKISEAEVQEVVDEMLTIMYLIEMVVVLLATVVGFTLAKYISRPIEALQDHADRIADGDLSELAETGSWTEVRELTLHFNEMVASLRDMNENLQQKVEERTAELTEANNKLEEMVIRDPLTGAHNRRYLSDALDKEFGRAARYKTPLSLVIFDVDHFKKVNDTYGHAAGDEVLVGICEYMARTLRETDVFARIGGEEFCLLLPTQQDVEVALERMRQGISELKFEAAGQEFRITSSFGWARMNPDIRNPEQLMKHADEALYIAKNGGRNRVVEFVAAADQ